MKPLGSGTYRIASDYLILLTELAFEQGISGADLLAGSGLPEQILFQPGVPLGHESCVRVLRRFCDLTQDPAIALEYGKRMTLSKHGALGYAAQYSATMADAAIKVMRYVETRAQVFELTRSDSPGWRHLSIRPRFDDALAGPFLTLAFLSSVETICRTLVGAHGHQAHSTIHLRSPLALAQQTVLPNCRVYGNADDNRLSWPAAALAHPLPFFNPELETLAEQQLEDALQHLTRPYDLLQRVRDILRSHLQERPTADDVAARLCMSSATLNRKLKAAHSSFQQLKDEVRHEQARHLLQAPETLALERIAEQLGFSDASNFAKAFKNWEGITPSRFRNR